MFTKGDENASGDGMQANREGWRLACRVLKRVDSDQGQKRLVYISNFQPMIPAACLDYPIWEKLRYAGAPHTDVPAKRSIRLSPRDRGGISNLEFWAGARNRV
jgi:hypothetical protein